MSISVHKFGANASVDAAEDIWSVGGDYPFPSAVATTTIVSDDAADAAAGTGAQTIKVYGHDANGIEVAQTITLNGTTAVELPTDISICYRIKVLRSGSNETNVGNIQVKHGATVIGQVDEDKGQTLMAIYRVPSDKYAVLHGWYCTIGKNKTATVTIEMLMRSPGGSWQVKEAISLGTASSGGWAFTYPNPLVINPRVEIRIRAVDVSTTGVFVSAGFDLVLQPLG